jgi:uncharacterized protein YegP (UPF0339 family)
MPGKFEIKKARNGRLFFNLLASNGEVILTSQMYKAKTSAKNGIASVKKNSRANSRFETRESKGGKGYFVLKARNHQVIGTSERYNSSAALNNGIKSVSKNASGAKIVYLTA